MHTKSGKIWILFTAIFLLLLFFCSLYIVWKGLSLNVYHLPVIKAQFHQINSVMVYTVSCALASILFVYLFAESHGLTHLVKRRSSCRYGRIVSVLALSIISIIQLVVIYAGVVPVQSELLEAGLMAHVEVLPINLVMMLRDRAPIFATAVLFPWLCILVPFIHDDLKKIFTGNTAEQTSPSYKRNWLPFFGALPVLLIITASYDYLCGYLSLVFKECFFEPGVGNRVLPSYLIMWTALSTLLYFSVVKKRQEQPSATTASPFVHTGLAAAIVLLLVSVNSSVVTHNVVTDEMAQIRSVLYAEAPLEQVRTFSDWAIDFIKVNLSLFGLASTAVLIHAFQWMIVGRPVNENRGNTHWR